VREVVFPVVGEQTLRAWSRGEGHGTELQDHAPDGDPQSYKGHYRRMAPDILQRLEFRSNNELIARSSRRSIS